MATAAAEKLRLSGEIVTSIGRAICDGDPMVEIQDMFVDTCSFRQVVSQWRHPETNMGLLQLAVRNQRLDLVRYLMDDKRKFSPWKPLHTDNGLVINSPFLLACKVGALDIMRYLMSLEGEMTDLMVLRSPGFVSLSGELDGSHRPKLPFEVCVDEGHVDCAMYLCNYILSASSYSETPDKVAMLNSSPVHQACHLGSARLLRLILSKITWRRYINAHDSLGFTPLHVAAMSGNPDCLSVLIEHGATVNLYAKCRSVLHLLYSTKSHPEAFVACTEILVKNGVDVNAPDHNENTPIDYVAYEFGQKLLPEVKSVLRSPYLTYDGKKVTDRLPQMKVKHYRKELLEVMRTLLASGAYTHTIISRGVDGVLVDHTTIHTLLQNSGWPLSSCLLNSCEDVYDALKLLFEYGCDPNVLAKHNLMSAFSTLLLLSIHEVRDIEMKCRFLYLFIHHGVDLECLVPPPRHFRKHPADRIWQVPPVLLALQEKHPPLIIQMMLDFMSVGYINSLLHSPKLHSWHIYVLHLEGNKPYKEEWASIKKSLRNKVRSLKHFCKLQILSSVKRNRALIGHLPLPQCLKTYLTGPQC